MSREPIISVITPTFNRAGLLMEAIDSVRQQTYSAWEMLIWDDGSTDGTQEAVQRCGDPRIRYHRGTNHGQAYSRNQAMAISKGEYIAFLDDDDKWLPGKLARQVEILEAHREVDILFANFENLETATGQMVVSFEKDLEIFSRMKSVPLQPKVSLIAGGFAECFLQRNFILPSSAIMRKGIYNTIGPFNEELRGTEDKEYWWRCAMRGARFSYDAEVLVKRRKGEDSFSASGERARTEDIKALYFCRQDAEILGQKDLLRLVNNATGATWENLIRFYLEQNQRRKALRAFTRRCRYGITRRAIALALGSLWGARILRRTGRHPAAVQREDRTQVADI